MIKNSFLLEAQAAMVLNDRVLALQKQHPLVVLCCLKLCLITFKWTLATSSVFWQFVTVAFILVGVDKICVFFLIHIPHN